MQPYSLKHLLDHDLLSDLHALVRRDRATTATLLAHLAEVEYRKLHLPAAYPSMFWYCVRELHMSEETALRRLRAARAARRFPAIFEAVADGRLHLTAVVLLAPYLTRTDPAELLVAAAHKTRKQIEQLLAERFPQEDLPTRVRYIEPASIALAATAPATTVQGEAPAAMPLVASVAESAMAPLVSTSIEPLAPAPVVPSRRQEMAHPVEPVRTHETPDSTPPRAKLPPLSPAATRCRSR